MVITNELRLAKKVFASRMAADMDPCLALSVVAPDNVVISIASKMESDPAS